MSTYLELCRLVANESGTVSGEVEPASVAGQTGRLYKIVRWTNQAWLDIQNAERWNWMIAEGTLATIAGMGSYSGDGLTRFAEWIVERRPYYDSGVTVRTALADEMPLVALDWPTFRRTMARGEPLQGKPQFFAIDPRRNLRLAPVPDAAYTLAFEYRKAPQTLFLDTDEPEMPARHHSVIVDRALDYLGIDDESVNQVPAWGARAARKMRDLMRDELPPIDFAGPLA